MDAPSLHPCQRRSVLGICADMVGDAGDRYVTGSSGPLEKSVAIAEWDSLNDAVAFYESKAWTDLAPERDNAVKIIRRYAVEVEM